MSDVTTDYCVGVFGHYGLRNLGDEAIPEAVIQNLRHRWPGARVVGFSMNPEDTARRHRVPAYPVRRSVGGTPAASHGNDAAAASVVAANRSLRTAVRDCLKRVAPLRALVNAARWLSRLPRNLWQEALFLQESFRIAKGVDFFLVAGSNQLLDNFGGVWGFPYTLFKWTLLARLAGARVAFLSVGAGPVDSRWSRILLRAALLLADYVSFRDIGSHRMIDWFGASNDWRVYPDLAQSLVFQRQPRRAPGSQPTVAINPMAIYDKRYWHAPDDARYERYIGQLARFASRLMRERYPVFFFATQPSDHGAIEDVIARLDHDPAATDKADLARRSGSVAEVMRVIGSADVIVATRFHGAVLALHAYRPVLGICYYRKTREVLREMDQEAYAVDLQDLDDDDLWRRFGSLVANLDGEARSIQRCSEEMCARLAEQYDRVLALLAHAKGRRRSALTRA